MAAIADADVSINAAGDIRWTGAATTNRHSILELIQWLMDKQDDGQAVGDDLLDITVETPFNRSTDQIVTLNAPFNVDAAFMDHFYDGSLSQEDPTFGGETLWSGLNIIGPSEVGTEYMIMQNGKVLAAYWGTGINAEASPSLVYSRHLVMSKFAGADIDGKRILVLSRELGDQYRRFPVTLGTGNSVAAIGNGADIFNTNPDATIAAWVITNTEGFQELDIDGTGLSGQEFYSQWDPGTQSINDTYEYTKWISQRAHVADETGGVPTGQDNVVDNATIQGQGQSFIPLANVTEKLAEARFRVKVGLGTPTGTLYAELWDSDDAGVGSALPTGAALARSEDILATAITSTYEEVIFRFNLKDPTDGSDQSAGLDMGNAEYFLVLRHDDGTVTDYFHVEGAASSVDSAMGSAVDTSATWGGASVNDINVIVKSCPAIHGVPGEIFQGIDRDVGYDGETGTGVAEDNIVMWGTKVFYDALTAGPFFPGEEVTFRADTVEDAENPIKSGGIVLYDDGTDELIVALDTPGAAVINDDDIIEGLRSGATAAINTGGGAIEDEDLGGGTGIVLAKDDNGTAGEIYIQVLTGVAPVDNNRIRRDDASGDPLLDYVDATAVIATRTLIPEFVGTSTGSNIIGAYGIGFNPADVGSSDRFTSLDNSPRVPPNNVSFTVSGLISGEDRVLVGPRSGTNLDRGQWLLATALSGAAETAVVVKTGSDTVPWVAAEINWPSTGTGADNSRLRVQMDSGIYRRVAYTVHDGVDTFTTASTNWSGISAAAINQNVFLAFIDVLCDAATESFTGVHGGTDRDLYVRVRDGGATPIKTFEAKTAQFLSTPQTVAAVRTSDA